MLVLLMLRALPRRAMRCIPWFRALVVRAASCLLWQAALTSNAGKWFEEPASANMLRAPTTEAVAPSTLSRIELEIGSQVKIPIFIFKATTEARVPSLKMYNAAAAERGDAPAIQRQSEYVCSDKPELSLAPEQVVSGAWAAGMPALHLL
jgi:hypothetical protein